MCTCSRYCIFGQTVNVAKQIRSFSLPGKILLTNSVRTTVSRNQKSNFTFTQHAVFEVGSTKVLTHFLEKNEKLSLWEICDVEKGPADSIDGYRELHNTEGAELWDSSKRAVLRQQQVIDAFRPGPSRTRRALTRLQSVKRKFRTAQSNDSGVSISEPNIESAVCSVM
ncbi:hypothetical protein ANCDUO_12289 [Ancylostoma duodenale]|uniref:Guanylate cyclase domain-containing protein n=1 Tax=Ancylostoma duodenale TaxID=51022 RepID=A0A0C2GF42_9BILA|nr:hypothetical protein ANCDUO_12289 [Ancylostoma duodenale]